MPPVRHCPKCGLDMPVSGWADLCPRCLVRVSLGQLDTAKAAVPAIAASDDITPPQSRAASSWPALLQPGPGGTRHFADYDLLEEIGRGGMGVVFKARQRSLNRIVAVKVLLGGSMASSQMAGRFHSEAEAIAQLHHPNIVAIYEAGQCDGTPFFALEYVPGRTLADLVTERPLAPETAARHVQTVAHAIHYAHEHGILHRDLKPSNVLIDALGQPRVTDFGLAKRLASEPGPLDHSGGKFDGDAELTLTGQVLGSPSYLAPEQA